MATSYTTKTSSDEMFADLINDPGYAHEVSQTWDLVKKLLKKRKEFNGVNLKKITEAQWEEIYKSITKDEKDRRLFNPIIANRNRSAIDDPEMWLYGPISEHEDIQKIILKHTQSLPQAPQAATGHAIAHTNQPGTAPIPPITGEPTTPFAEEARLQLQAAQHPTQQAPLPKEAIQTKATQLEQHAKTAQHMQDIRTNAARVASPATSIATPPVGTQQREQSRPVPTSDSFKAFDTRARHLQQTLSSGVSPAETTEYDEQPKQTSYSSPSYREQASHDDHEEEGMRRRRRSPNLRRFNPRGAVKGARGAARAARGAGQAVRGIATLVRAAPLLANPYVLAGIGIAALILLVVVLMVKPGDDGSGKVTSQKDTNSTTVPNPPDQCTTTPSQCLTAFSPESPLRSAVAQANEPAVLAANDLFGSLLNLIDSEITYTITAGYDGAANDIIVTDPIPTDSSGKMLAGFIIASGKCHVARNPERQISAVWWSVKENLGIDQSQLTCTGVGAASEIPPTEASGYTGSGSAQILPSMVFQDRILPLAKDQLFTSSQSIVEVIGAQGTGSASMTPSPIGSTDTSGTIDVGPNPSPNTSDCGGVYSLNGGQHNGKNFGDPDCQLAKSGRVSYDFNGRHWSNVPKAMVDLLKQLDPAGVGYWIGISACEAPGFDPNNVSVAVNGSAYGLFQMGARFVNGQESPFGEGVGLNGQYDRGDANWKTQVSNAVNYHLRNLGGGWAYWECARIVWGL